MYMNNNNASLCFQGLCQCTLGGNEKPQKVLNSRKQLTWEMVPGGITAILECVRNLLTPVFGHLFLVPFNHVNDLIHGTMFTTVNSRCTWHMTKDFIPDFITRICNIFW